MQLIYTDFLTLQVRVPTYEYVAVGVSSNKKDAATNAARDFISYLIRESKVKETDLPFSLTGAASSFDNNSSGGNNGSDNHANNGSGSASVNRGNVLVQTSYPSQIPFGV